jgi:hypothetical protein
VVPDVGFASHQMCSCMIIGICWSSFWSSYYARQAYVIPAACHCLRMLRLIHISKLSSRSNLTIWRGAVAKLTCSAVLAAKRCVPEYFDQQTAV